ncbi:LRR receptor-like serine/threonine-protein kinase EFR [Syzygium oleosum]|uniref:LRR receptor-like serine/threonine-protein kinase EFR n=1 Tax=Syzygium oleosum TaxID=219896 RepID=UPI0024BA4694|nr:LRR receptor-like serine/threonine-protein kinase EFR [Syzygium oleosum]
MEKFIFSAFVDVLLASLLMFQPVICSGNFTDQEALLHFKLTMEVDPMNTIKGGNWTVEANFCEWISVVCSNRRQRVTALDLSYMEIGRLHRLKELILEENHFEGNIPPNLAWCQNLEVMSLAMNRLTGGIPREFGAFPNLQQLFLSFNNLLGQIPSVLGNITTLQGSIPRNMDSLQKLQELYLGANNFSGTIPRTIGNMSSLNMLDGEVPQEVFNISSLQVLALTENSLSGSLPSGCDLSLPNLKKLYLGDNGFGGNIPQYFSNFSNLIRLEVGHNQLSGPIPTSLGNLKNLRHFGVHSNQLTGETYGAELGFLSAFI